MSQAPDEDYFIRPPARNLRAWGARPDELPFAAGSAAVTQRVFSVLFVLGGIFGGFAVPLALNLLSVMFSSPSPGEQMFALALGAFVAVCGIAAGVSTWMPWRRPPALIIGFDDVTVRYPGFAQPLVIPRALVRVASVDPRPVVLFQRNDRFPVEGRVPAEAFVDALDVHTTNPWEPASPEERALFPFPSPLRSTHQQHLFTADGSALPFLRVNPIDVPNLAIVLDESIKSPRMGIGLTLFGRVPLFRGGRAVRGMLIRVAEPARAAAAFERWDVLRPITVDDVIEEKLLLPKPLFGWRAVTYAALLIGPAIIHVLRDIL